MSLTVYRTLGRSGLRVSPLALGAMTFDDGSWGSAPRTSFEILDRYLDAGGNFVGTANMDASDPNSGGAGRKAIRAQLDASLRRLNTDHVDLYWMHQWDRHTPIEETLATLDDLVRAGKVHAIGLSNAPAWWIAEAVTIARFRGWETVAALQVEYSLLARTVEGEIFGAAWHFGLGVTPWSPLASGALSGKYSRSRTTADGSGRTAYAGAHLTESTFVVLDTLERIAAELGTTVAATALAWVRQRREVTSTLIGARTVAQLEDNLASVDVTLTTEHIAELDGHTTPALNYPHTVSETMVGFQQGDTTVNGLSARAFVR